MKIAFVCAALFVIIGLAIGNPALDECIKTQGADVCHAKHY